MRRCTFELRLSMASERGFSMIEVLVTIVILSVGLLGMAGLQVRALTAQMEAYQREQALVLVKDIADRIDANRKNAASYAGTIDSAAACPTGTTRAALDLAEWCDALKGVSEKAGAMAKNVGGIIGAVGCVTQVSAGSVPPTPGAPGAPAEYLVAVAWQGLDSTRAPAVTCGQGSYGDDKLRRVISLPVRIANLL